MDLGHLHRVRVRAGKLKALVVLVHIAVLAVHHVLLPVLRLQVDPVPTGGELDVYLKLCNYRTYVMRLDVNLIFSKYSLTPTCIKGKESMYFLT